MMIEGMPGSTRQDQRRLPKDDTLQEPKHYGLHRHFTGGSSVVMFGGGMKKRLPLRRDGAGAAARGDQGPGQHHRPARHVFTAMGISPKTVFEIENRPFYATQDGKGKPVMDLFA